MVDYIKSKMHTILQKHHTKLKWLSLISLTSGTVWIIRQVRKTREILDNAIDTSIIDLLEPPPHLTDMDDKLEYTSPQWIETPTESDANISTMWNSLKFMYARRLLNLTKSDNHKIRLRSINHLAGLKKLEHWQYSLLAHTCDSATAVGLARVYGVNPKLFAQPPKKFFDYDNNMLINELKDYLIELDKRSDHSCLSKFIDQAFMEESHKIIDQDMSSIELTKFIKSGTDIILLCIETILHHTETKDYAKDILLNNGLYLLMEIYNRYKDNLSANILLSRIFSNLSTFPELLDDIHKSGWIGIMANWLGHNDIRVSLPASCALANLDVMSKYKYDKQIFPVHPVYRNSGKLNADIVLVHGLLGGIFFTWRQRDKNETTLGFMGKKKGNASITSRDVTGEVFYKSSDPVTREYLENMEEQQQDIWEDIGSDYEMVYYDMPTYTNEAAEGPYTGNDKIDRNDDKLTKCWPKDWLPKDCPNIRVIGVNYETSLSTWTAFCPHGRQKNKLDDRSNEIMMQLLKAGVGDKPIIWITHSMGGLLVKKILSLAWESDDNNLKKIFNRTKGIVFYSTPHFGSKVANLNPAVSLLLWPSIEVQELRLESPNLKELHQDFLKILQKASVQIVSFVETKSTIFTALKLSFILVERGSGDPQIGEYFEIPQDHLGICKPANRHSFLYQKVVYLVKDILKREDMQYGFTNDF